MSSLGTSSAGSEEGFELVDGSRFRDDFDDESHPLNDDNVDADEEDNPDSSNSSIFEVIAEVNGDNTDDFSSSPVFLQQYQSFFGKRRSKFKFAMLGCIASVLILSWVYVLLSNSPHKEAKSSDSLSSSTTIDSLSTNSATVSTSTREIPTSTTAKPPQQTFISQKPPAKQNETPYEGDLKEFDIHKERQDILHEEFNKGSVFSVVKLIPSNSYITKKDDEGLYLVEENQFFVVKKLGDDQFQKSIHKIGDFTYKDITFNVRDVILSYDLQYAIIVADYQRQYRHSGLAHYWLYDIAKDTYVEIKSGDSKVQHASWSPNYKLITFIQDNDLYILEVSSGSIRRITDDGSSIIYNGRPDWVYEEDVQGKDHAFWWSPDETTLIYMKTDDSNVETLNLETFVNNDNYPQIRKLKYPKPGDANPTVRLFQYNWQEESTFEIDRSDSTLGDEYIVYGATWIDEQSFIIKETNRDSKILNYRLFNINNKSSKVTYSINALKEYNGWVENTGDILRIPRDNNKGRPKSGYVDVLVNDGYNHLAYFESGDAKTPVFLTSGDWEVLDGAIMFDLEDDRVYFTANRRSTFEKHLYAVSLKTKEMTIITDSKQDKTGYYETSFSPSTRFLVSTKEGPGFPMIYQHDDLAKRSVDFSGSSRTYHTVQIGADESGNPITVNLVERRPKGFDENNKHPLLVHVYGGPGSQFVDVKFHVNMEDTVSDELNSVILYVDPRGTGGQGWKYRSWVNGRIGYYEPRDITAAVKKWVASHNYIDPERTTIWGWSYGGFTVLKTLEYDQGDVFKYGMAVAPVTNWLMYDSIYTERYMGTPNSNEEGYKESKVNEFDVFKKVKRFFLAHGTADDNVHIQNTFKLLDEFNLHNVYNYDLQIYPDSDHSISHHNANSLLTGRLLAWLANAFEGKFDQLH